MGKHQLAVLLIVDTDDPQLSLDAMRQFKTANDYTRFRKRFFDSLPGSATRLVAAMSVEEAELMVRAHDLAKREIGLPATTYPPSDYVPPTREQS